MNWIDYREQIGIGFNDNTKLQMCINRVKNLSQQLDAYYTEDNLFQYVNIVGVDYELFNRNKQTPLRFALNSVCESFSLKELISKYVALINSARETCITEDGDHFLCQLLESVIVGTLEAYRIPYEIIYDDEGAFIFPKGVPEFDKELVSDTLLWLSRYPETEKEWKKALKAYSSGDEPSEIADQFRKTLERFFQNYFVSEKSLEKLTPEYGKCLKGHGIPEEITANLVNLIEQYTRFMNNYAKHHDRTSKLLLEYIMYQTGNIIRLLLMLEAE